MMEANFLFQLKVVENHLHLKLVVNSMKEANFQLYLIVEVLQLNLEVVVIPFKLKLAANSLMVFNFLFMQLRVVEDHLQ